MRPQHALEKALALLVCTALMPERAFALDCDPHAGQMCPGAAPGTSEPCPYCDDCPEFNAPPDCHCVCGGSPAPQPPDEPEPEPAPPPPPPSCGEAPSPPHSSGDCSGELIAGQSCTASCDSCYDGGSATFMCDADGHLSGGPLNCDENTCNLHGTCSGNICSCAGGWGGERCDVDPCTNVNPCANEHGECHVTEEPPFTECLCTGGWTGESCENGPVTPEHIRSNNPDPQLAVAGETVTLSVQTPMRVEELYVVFSVTSWYNYNLPCRKEDQEPQETVCGQDDIGWFEGTTTDHTNWIFNLTIPSTSQSADGRVCFKSFPARLTSSSDPWSYLETAGGCTEDTDSPPHYVVVRAEPTTCPDPAADNYDLNQASRLALGGWCMADGQKCHWDTSTSSIVLVGGFAPDCRVLPDTYPWVTQGPQRVYLALGGDCVGEAHSDRCIGNPVAQTFQHCAIDFKDEIVKYLLQTQAEGVAFDLEGWLAGTTNEQIRDFVTDLRKDLPQLKIALTTLNTPDMFHFNYFGSWVDFVTPMMYGGWNSYQNDDPIAALHFSKWIGDGEGEAGWPASKVFLTYQTDSAAGARQGPAHHEVVRYLAQQVEKGGFAGLLGWPSTFIAGDPGCATVGDSGCCEASCDTPPPPGHDCDQQEQEHKEACDAKGWSWLDQDHQTHPYTCCPVFSGNPAQATTREIQAVAAAQLGADVGPPSASDNHGCHYTQTGLVDHFDLGITLSYFGGTDGWPEASATPYFASSGINFVFQGHGRTPLSVRIEASQNSNLVLRHVRMANLHSTTNGGAVSLVDGFLIVEYSTFEGNIAAGMSGGALYASRATEVWIEGSSFLRNSAGTGDALFLADGGGGGGAVSLTDTTGRVMISDSSFESNAASGGGGASVLVQGRAHLFPVFSPFFPVFCAFSPSRRGGWNRAPSRNPGPRNRR